MTKQPIITKKQALLLTRDMWDLIADKGINKYDACNMVKGSRNQPFNSCFLCEYASSHKRIKDGNSCNCPIWGKWGETRKLACADKNGYYDMYLWASNSDKPIWAKKIADACREELEKIRIKAAKE